MGQYMNDDSVTVNLAKVLLMLINMAFMVGGGLLVYFSQRVKSSGWLEAFKGDYAWVGDSTVLFILVLGAVVIALSALGCFAALLRNRVLLTVYAVVLLITAALFVVVAIGGHSVKSKAQDWEAATFPAADEESAVATNFNALYCYAQVVYYCKEAQAADIVSLFGINVPTGTLSTYKLTDLCDASIRLQQLDQICQVCALVNKYADYAPVADWAETSCQRTTANQVWCGAFLLSGNGSAVFSNGSPYSGCRTSFLDLVIKWSNFLFACALIVCLSTVLVFGFSCLVRRGTNRPYLDDSFVVDTPSPRR